jgi:hypothetical protein
MAVATRQTIPQSQLLFETTLHGEAPCPRKAGAQLTFSSPTNATGRTMMGSMMRL